MGSFNQDILRWWQEKNLESGVSGTKHSKLSCNNAIFPNCMTKISSFLGSLQPHFCEQHSIIYKCCHDVSWMCSRHIITKLFPPIFSICITSQCVDNLLTKTSCSKWYDNIQNPTKKHAFCRFHWFYIVIHPITSLKTLEGVKKSYLIFWYCK